MIASTSSGLQWHVIDRIRGCLYGEVLRAMEVSRGGFYAIKVRTLCVLPAPLTCAGDEADNLFETTGKTYR